MAARIVVPEFKEGASCPRSSTADQQKAGYFNRRFGGKLLRYLQESPIEALAQGCANAKREQIENHNFDLRLQIAAGCPILQILNAHRDVPMRATAPERSRPTRLLSNMQVDRAARQYPRKL